MEKIAITQSMLDEAWEKKRRYNILLTYQHFCPMCGKQMHVRYDDLEWYVCECGYKEMTPDF